MHILGGKLKGKKLANFKSKSIRPAMALVRKSIFDTLKDFVQSSNVLDLCAGTGINGIEALSRGAQSLTLIDSSKIATKIINKNLNLCNLSANVIQGVLPNVLNKLHDKFHLVFLDPPYGESLFIEQTLEKLLTSNLMSKNSLVVIESEFKSNFLTPKEFKLYKEKKFGNTKVIFLSYII